MLLTGLPDEHEVIEEVLSEMARPAENMCGRLSLRGLAGLLSRCSLVVANDTGPLHLAAAMGTATVGVYWCGNFVNGGPMTRARNRSAISWRVHCPDCGADCLRGGCEHRSSFTAEIRVDEVLEPALSLLSARASSH